MTDQPQTLHALLFAGDKPGLEHAVIGDRCKTFDCALASIHLISDAGRLVLGRVELDRKPVDALAYRARHSAAAEVVKQSSTTAPAGMVLVGWLQEIEWIDGWGSPSFLNQQDKPAPWIERIPNPELTQPIFKSELLTPVYKFAAAPAAQVAVREPGLSAAELIVRDVCESDPAYPEDSNTVCVNVDDLLTFAQERIAEAAAPAVVVDEAADQLVVRLDELLATQGRLMFARDRYDDEQATNFGVALLDFMRLHGTELRHRAALAAALQGVE